MDYQKVIEQARTCIGPYCKACAVCNGRACKNTMPGPGAKGIGDVAIRNFQKWQEIRINMDTICEKKPALLAGTILLLGKASEGNVLQHPGTTSRLQQVPLTRSQLRSLKGIRG